MTVWIVLYVAGASLVCMLLMAADFINGLLTKKYWFPCKFFTLNAAISAVLAIALKMPGDLATPMPSGRDQLMKLCGTTLMSVSMANFMPSLADMSDADLFVNLISIAVFIVPLISNICIQIGTGVISRSMATQHVIIIVCISLQFAFLVSIALASTSVNKCFKLKYKGVFDHFRGDRETKMLYIRSLWIMSNTQFVIVRNITFIASGAICLMSVVVLAVAALQLYVPMSKRHAFFHPNSDYEWSTNFIVVAQLAAILVGSISPLYRSWYVIVLDIITSDEDITHLDLADEYWSKRLIELKNRRNVEINRLVRCWKDFYLSISLIFYLFTITLCWIIGIATLLFFFPFFICYAMITKDFSKEKLDVPELDLTLEESPIVSKDTVNEMNDLADDYINKRIEKAKSMKLVEFLERAREFDGIKEFDSILIQSLTNIKLPEVSNHRNRNNWTLRVVTLSIIAYELYARSDEILGKVPIGKIEFVSMVINIIRYVGYIEKTVDVDEDDIGVGDAAIDLWWFSIDMLSKMRRTSSLKTQLEKLIELSEKYIRYNRLDKFRVGTGNWMKETVVIFIGFLDSEKGKEIEFNQQLFDKLSGMIADLLIACSVNLTKAISINMSNNSFERKATIKDEISVLVETDPITGFIDERKSVILGSPDYKEYLEESWWKFVIPPIRVDMDHNLPPPQRELLQQQPSNSEIVPYEEEE